jgi:CheY-like chemotaxis protein
VPANQTVLLVDDEEDIRELATLTLEEQGYRILSAPNAQEAIVLAEKHAGEISALVTDVIMPGMTGVQLAGVLSRIIPGLRVLFVSGHSNETITEQTLAETHASYLQKPYFGDALATKLAEVLTTPRALAA